MRNVFVGSKGIRSGWLLLIFFAILLAVQEALLNAEIRIPIIANAMQALEKGTFSPFALLTNELTLVVAALVAIAVMSKIERRHILAYGFQPHSGAARRLMWGLSSAWEWLQRCMCSNSANMCIRLDRRCCARALPWWRLWFGPWTVFW